MDNKMLNTKNYSHKNWIDTFPDTVDMCEIPLYSTWKNYFHDKFEHKKFQNVEKLLTEEIRSEVDIFPYPDLTFNIFNQLSLDNIRVMMIGMDPYIRSEEHNNIKIPQAMGASFSVPIGMKIPSSLNNIFRNQMEYKVIQSKPLHGNLQSWISQGCFLFNTALSVREGKSGSHIQVWQEMSDQVIQHISKELNDVVFVLWGGDALKKYKLIDKSKHKVIMSSHPSGFSYFNPIGNYPAFAKVNHFKQINDYLISSGHDSIVWELF